jgi:hypothetical protein
MPCLSGKFSPAEGIILSLACLPPGTWTPETNPAPKYFPALLDTGASHTCISPKVARDVGLLPAGMLQMASATHVNVTVNTYLIDVGIVIGGAVWWEFTNLLVLEFQPSAASPYEMLIGRDVICQGALAVSSDGHYTFSI